MSCQVYSKSFVSNINYGKDFNLNLDWLKNQIERNKNISSIAQDPSESGIWFPVYIYKSEENTCFDRTLLQRVDNSYAKPFSPCACSDDQMLGLSDNYYGVDSGYEPDMDFSYCGSYTEYNDDPNAKWYLYDVNKDMEQSPQGFDMGVGSIDIVSKVDDVLPKVPILNQIYVSGFYDFKWHRPGKKFPAVTNDGLGKQGFFSSSSFKGLSVTKSSGEDPFFAIDWNIHPTISEVEYDPIESQHTSEHRHNKSYAKSLMLSETCGNFMLLSLPTGHETYAKKFPILKDYTPSGTGEGPPSLDPNRTLNIPAKENYTKPYGWKNRTYDNIFIGQEKKASYWNWSINTAVLCWFRVYDIDRVNDPRPISGVDLYISPGDVFWATNDGPEPDAPDSMIAPTGEASGIKPCPSGLKFVDGVNIGGVIPNNSSFIYVSENLYSRFHDLFTVYREEFLLPDEQAMRLASVLCTAPLYDGFTTDLISIQAKKLKYYEEYNDFQQIKVLNKLMLQGTYYDSANGLNYISSEMELINTLYNKYGGYIWIPPKTNANISFTFAENSKSIMADLDFDLVPTTIPYYWTNQNLRMNCNTDPFDQSYRINYSCDQSFIFGDMALYTSIDPSMRYKQTCRTFTRPSGTGVMYYNKLVDSDYTIYAGIYLNGNAIDSYPVFSGTTEFYDVYPRISLPENNRGQCSGCGEQSSWALADAEDLLCDPVYEASNIQSLFDNKPTPTPAPSESEQIRIRIMESISSEPPVSEPPPPEEEEDPTFCPGSLSYKYNQIDKGKRTLRTLADNTLYFRRKYRALVNNVHLDSVAFHPNGGIFYDSAYASKTVFDKRLSSIDTKTNSLTVGFSTSADAGIKLYRAYVEKLQSNEEKSHSCKRFPIRDTSCKCYGLNLNRFAQHPVQCGDVQSYPLSTLYVPNLSTKYSARLEYLGGYSNNQLSAIFGITNPIRPSDKHLPDILQKRDPENPYACRKYASIGLNNYTTTEYNLTLKNFSTNHSDILATVYEAADLTGGPTNFSQDDEGNDTSTTNTYWKRFLNRVTVNGVPLYNQQTKIIQASSNVNVVITNPYLNALIGNSNEKLAFPTGDPCAITNSQPIIGSSRGDETSNIFLSFEQRPKKHLLNFSMSMAKSSGSEGQRISAWSEFKPYTFYPKFGLKESESDLGKDAIDEHGNISYYSGNAESVFGGILSIKHVDILSKISAFSKHRKIRYYNATENSDDNITMAYIPNSGGYTINDLQFIGKPHFFEYLKQSRDLTSHLVPAIPRKETYLNYILREQEYEFYQGQGNLVIDPKKSLYKNAFNKVFSDIAYNEEEFIFDLKDYKILKIPGVREYFRTTQSNKIWSLDIPIEKFNAINIIAKLKEDGIIGSETQNENGETTTEEKNSLKPYDLIQTIQNPGSYYVYVGGTDTLERSYLYIGTNSDMFFLRSSLDIDYENTSAKGYVYNTAKPCNEKVYIHYKDRRSYSAKENTIVQKAIYVEFYTKEGRKVSKQAPENKYLKIYTVLAFRDKVLRFDDETGSIIPIRNINRTKTSLLVYDNILNLSDTDSLLNNDAYRTKWGDLILYDGDFINNPYVIKHHRKNLPNTPYENIFYKQIVNNYSQEFNFTIHKGFNTDDYQQQLIKIDNFYNIPSFNILQKYDLLRHKVWAPPLEQYENYIPIMEINLQTLENFKHTQITGYITSDALFSSYQNDPIPPGYIDPNNPFNYENPNNFDLQNLFFHTVRDWEYAFIPPSEFYSTTLRIDDPAFILNRTIKKDQTSQRADARRIFKPKNMGAITNRVDTIIPAKWKRQTIDRSHPFYLKSAYADLDSPGPCYPKKCSMPTAGYIGLYSQFISADPGDVFNAYDPKKSQKGYISYDAGLYNPLGDTRYITIRRTELEYENPIESDITCNTNSPLPSYATKTFLTKYQDHINENFFDYNKNGYTGDEYNVMAMDRHANEMLFRIYYGEKQKVNRKQAYVDTKLLTLEDLIGYTDPKITPKYLYDEILYNYDQGTKQEITFNGTLNIAGTKENGDVISLTVAGVPINLALVESSYGLTIYGKVGGESINHRIYDRLLVNNRLATTDHVVYKNVSQEPSYSGEEDREIDNSPPPDPQPTGPNETVTLLATQTYTASAGWRTVVNIDPDIENDMPAGGGNAETGVGTNLAIVYREQKPESFLCHEPSKAYDPYTYGYCSIETDEEGDGCSQCEDHEGLINNFEGVEARVFDYTFEQCSVTFELKGHAYRRKFGGPNDEEPIEEEAEEDKGWIGEIGESVIDVVETIKEAGAVICSNVGPELCPVMAIGYGCWVETCYSYWEGVYTCEKEKIEPSITLTRKVFKIQSTTDLGEYSPPVCPEQFITISYNNKNVTVSLPRAKAALYTDNETSTLYQDTNYIDYCVPVNITEGCPDIFVSQIPPKYTITETINSSCDECAQNASVELQNHKNDFTYIDYTAVCTVGRLTWGDLQGAPLIQVGFRASDGVDDFGRSNPPCYGNVGSLQALCGGGLPWTSCVNGAVIKSGKNIQNICGRNTQDDPTVIECDSNGVYVQHNSWLAQEHYELWKENIEKQFNQTFLGSSNPQSYSGPLYDLKIRPEIPSSVIIQGVIPGTAKLNFETQSVTVPKFRPLPDGGAEESTWVANSSIAYITYTYRKAKTVQDVLIGNDKPEGNILRKYDSHGMLIDIKTDNHLGNCPTNEFPELYYSYYEFTPDPANPRPVPLKETYLTTIATIKKTSCTDTIGCYDKYINNQTICNKSDWLCWGATDFRNRRAFLSRLYGENWI